MHRLPKRTSFDVSFIHLKTYILARETRNSRINHNASKPVIRVKIGRRIIKNRNTSNTLKLLLIQLMNSPSASHMIVEHHHLATTNTCTNITHPIVIPNMRMLIVRSIITRLSSIKHRTLSLLLSRAHKRSSTRSSNHLITVKRQTSKLAKSTTPLSFIFRTQRLSRILQYRNLKLISDIHNLIHFSRHTIQMHRNNSLRLLTRLSNLIHNSLSKMHRRHIPSVRLTINKNRRSTQILNRIGRSRKSKTLANHLIPRPHTQLNQSKMNSRST